MSKSIKKMLLFVALLIVVIVIILVVYLLLPEPGGETAGSPSPSAPASASVSPSPSESSAVQTETPSPTDNGDVTMEETADGIKYTITVEGAFLTYSIIADSIIFEHLRTDGGDTFMDVSEAGEYLSIHFIEGAKATVLAPSFLDPLIDYKEFEQSGINFIPGTEIPGETVTANDGNMQLEAWLVDTDKGVLAVVASYSLRYKDDETAKLYKILGTLAIEQ